MAPIKVPSLHYEAPETVKPALHVGWHVVPLLSSLVQSPIVPFETVAVASQVFKIYPVLTQVALVRVPLLHEVLPLASYPLSQEMKQELPLARAESQDPNPPLGGLAPASQVVELSAALFLFSALGSDTVPAVVSLNDKKSA